MGFNAVVIEVWITNQLILCCRSVLIHNRFGTWDQRSPPSSICMTIFTDPAYSLSSFDPFCSTRLPWQPGRPDQMHHVALWPALPEMQNKLSKKRHSYSKQGAGSENIVTQMEEGGDLWQRTHENHKKHRCYGEYMWREAHTYECTLQFALQI